MPKSWHDRHSIMDIENEEKRNLYRNIIADRKPYFMRYIYPQLMKQYNTYINNTNKNALRRFQMTVDEMLDMPAGKLNEEQLTFLRYYHSKLPVGTGDCVMNRICRAFEQEFDGYIGKHNTSSKFNYGIMRSNAEYLPYQFFQVKKIYEDFNKRIKNYAVYSDYERIDDASAAIEMDTMCDDFRRECDVICPDSDSLSNIILDLCYTRSATKQFAWKMCSHDMINNLLVNQGYTISFPVKDGSGDIQYCGERFSVMTKRIEVIEE